jgi:hypothetical protein
VVRKLLAEGRLEIMTGGWVMTDEATTHIYGMLDQLIEGETYNSQHFHGELARWKMALTITLNLEARN